MNVSEFCKTLYFLMVALRGKRTIRHKCGAGLGILAYACGKTWRGRIEWEDQAGQNHLFAKKD